jgi:hypothetical protein
MLCHGKIVDKLFTCDFARHHRHAVPVVLHGRLAPNWLLSWYEVMNKADLQTACTCQRPVAYIVTHCTLPVSAAGNAGVPMSATSPADCPMALAVTSMSDYNGAPGGGATPSYETDKDDTFTDFSNWGSSSQANRIVAGPGEK